MLDWLSLVSVKSHSKSICHEIPTPLPSHYYVISCIRLFWSLCWWYMFFKTTMRLCREVCSGSCLVWSEQLADWIFFLDSTHLFYFLKAPFWMFFVQRRHTAQFDLKRAYKQWQLQIFAFVLVQRSTNAVSKFYIWWETRHFLRTRAASA